MGDHLKYRRNIKLAMQDVAEEMKISKTKLNKLIIKQDNKATILFWKKFYTRYPNLKHVNSLYYCPDCRVFDVEQSSTVEGNIFDLMNFTNFLGGEKLFDKIFK